MNSGFISYRITGLILGIFVSVSAWAQDAVLEERFKDFFYSDQISPRHCGQNVDRFVTALREEGILPDTFRVVFFSNSSGGWGFGTVLLPLNSRWGQPMGGAFVEKWQFHVVGLNDGNVYDFSFGPEPTVIDLPGYIDKMFLTPEGETNVLPHGETFRIFPERQGPAYLRRYSIEEISTLDSAVSIPIGPAKSVLEWKGRGPDRLIERYFQNRSSL